MDRLPTGVTGLDALINGGTPLRNQVIIAGGPGSGKTLICFEMLYRSARSGIPALFISFEERANDVIASAKAAFTDFNDIDSLISKKILSVVNNDMSLDMFTDASTDINLVFGNIINNIAKLVKGSGAKIVAVDSISLLKLISDGKGKLAYRRAVLSLISTLREAGVTAYLTIELPTTDRSKLRFSPEFFMFDGVIVMYETIDEGKRTADIEVIKMRGTKHSLSTTPYEITDNGFRIFTVQEY